MILVQNYQCNLITNAHVVSYTTLGEIKTFDAYEIRFAKDEEKGRLIGITTFRTKDLFNNVNYGFAYSISERIVKEYIGEQIKHGK